MKLQDDELRLMRIARLQAGVVARAQALRHISAAMIHHRLSTGKWRAIHRGVYLTNPRTIADDHRRWAAVLAAGAEACLGGVSGLQVHGLLGIRAPTVDVLIPAAARLQAPRGVRVHRTRQPPLADEVGSAAGDATG